MKENRLIFFGNLEGPKSSQESVDQQTEKKEVTQEEMDKVEESAQATLKAMEATEEQHLQDEQDAEEFLKLLDELEPKERVADGRLDRLVKFIHGGDGISEAAVQHFVENHLEYTYQDGQEKIKKALVKSPGGINGDALNVLLDAMDMVDTRPIVVAKAENILYMSKTYQGGNFLEDGNLKFLVDHHKDVPFAILHDIQLYLDPKYKDENLVMSQITGVDLTVKPAEQVEQTERNIKKAKNRMKRFEDLVLSGTKVSDAAAEDIASYADIVGSKPITDLLKIANDSISYKGVTALLASVEDKINPLLFQDIADAQAERIYQSKEVSHDAFRFSVAFARKMSSDKVGFLEAYMSDVQKMGLNNALS